MMTPEASAAYDEDLRHKHTPQANNAGWLDGRDGHALGMRPEHVWDSWKSREPPGAGDFPVSNNPAQENINRFKNMEAKLNHVDKWFEPEDQPTVPIDQMHGIDQWREDKPKELEMMNNDLLTKPQRFVEAKIDEQR